MQMVRPTILESTDWAMLSALVAAAATAAAAAARPAPNIVLFVIDDLGFADLSLVGAANRTGGGRALDYKTPNIDKLAREGIVLDSYYVNRLCSPTRTSLLSSRYAYTLGLAGGVITNGFPVALRLNETTIADHLRPLGYTTHGFGKWDIGYHTWNHTPTFRGFDTWLGYYNADEDYFTHACGGGGCGAAALDLRNGTSALLSVDGVYSTELYTAEGLRILEHHDASAGKPFFIYGAYQALHGPLEAPQRYLDRCANVVEHDRHIYCGMAQALDDGVGNITAALARLGLLDNTIIGLTADNGGQNGVGGNNWPLRGNKATVFEGGVRGNAFFWGGSATRLATRGPPRPRLSTALMHNVDWGPTLVSAAGGNASAVIAQHKLDGMDLWATLVATPATLPSAPPAFQALAWALHPRRGDVISAPFDYGPRADVLLHLQGPDNGYAEEGWELTAALRMGDWKVVANQVEAPCPEAANISGSSCLKRATGWVQLHQDGDGRWADRSYVKPDASQVCDNGTVCLFNLREDPFEQRNVADANPDVVARLMARLAQYNATRIPNQKQPFDNRACPQHFPHDVWTPWLNSTPPLPGPKPSAGPQFNSSLAPLRRSADGASLDVAGWCCDPLLAHAGEPNGTAPSTVQFSVAARSGGGGRGNPGPFTVVGTALANIMRPKLVELHKCPNLNHGFDFNLTLAPYRAEQQYALRVEALRPWSGGKVPLGKGGDLCFYGSGKAC